MVESVLDSILGVKDFGGRGYVVIFFYKVKLFVRGKGPFFKGGGCLKDGFDKGHV